MFARGLRAFPAIAGFICYRFLNRTALVESDYPSIPASNKDENTLQRYNRKGKKCATSPVNSELNGDDYYILAAKVSAMRSKDPTCQVGCVIANKEGVIVGTGYNGFPIGCDDDVFPWGKNSKDPLENKYAYVVHAEANALLNKVGNNLEGCILYTTLFPCNQCAKLIIQCRIGKVKYLNDRTSWEFQASRKMLDAAGIPYEPVNLSNDKITVTLTQK